MSKKRVQLDKNSVDLLTFSAGDLITILSEDKSIMDVKQTAFDYYNEETKEQFQIKVIVTRDENEFKDWTDVECTRNYTPKK